MTQKGFASLLILIALAGIVGVGVVAYGFFIAKQQSFFIAKQQGLAPGATTQTTEKSTARTVTLPPVQASIGVGSPSCPELDYTGCDTSGEFMTWKDDGTKDSEPASQSTIILK